MISIGRLLVGDSMSLLTGLIVRQAFVQGIHDPLLQAREGKLRHRATS